MALKYSKRALVTGGNRGIGLAIARGLSIGHFNSAIVTLSPSKLQPPTRTPIERPIPKQTAN
ncbi:hypothetical protein [Synechococcus sp. PCC 7336]|uniref:hypothetical protein n=1 Tax=Synechococcus sp. PCC 7336 TaxID=195250 RepID=UPI00034CC68D|nr:hypothetical protein [Synechococcus sp. PCC 7336]